MTSLVNFIAFCLITSLGFWAAFDIPEMDLWGRILIAYITGYFAHEFLTSKGKEEKDG